MGSAQVRGGGSGLHWEFCLEIAGRGAGGRDWIPGGTGYSESAPERGGQRFLAQPAKGGVWPARDAGGGQAGEIPSISPLAAGNESQEFGRSATRTGSREGPGLPGATPSWD